ncbi:hypothetical protein [Cypionkella sp.]|uniref:hypothetical protein n=1 Tax=Cypionkella sp. TaxID=2811411 RepID=UPI00271697A6|nr:hypothetical protein [Cypionkella sp.]MDO8983023.1 hypothetical protein [Cypionkella sp.]
MSVTVTQTPLDHIPEDFTLESLAASLTPQEIDALNAGEDPIISEADPAADEIAAQAVIDQAAVAAAAKPTPPPIPDTTAAEGLIADIDTKIEALKTQFDDGDLTHSEWMSQQTVLIKQQAQAQVQIERAAVAISENVASRRQDFETTLAGYKTTNEFLWGVDHLQGWDQALRTVTGNGQYAALPMQRQIELAHDLYAANVKAVSGKAIKGTEAAAAAEAVTPKPGPRTDARPEAIQTLGGFNGDGDAAIDDGGFAAIDRLSQTDPLEAERRVAAMSADKQQDYLRRGV